MSGERLDLTRPLQTRDGRKVVWGDDAQVVTTLCEKRYAERGEFIGVLITVMELEE